MNTEEFVQGFYKEKQDIIKEYLSRKPTTSVGALIKSLNLSDHQTKIMEEIINNTCTDIYYSILLGLEGSAAIGGVQQRYDLKDSSGNQLNDGDIGGYAYEYFQETN
ncbi:hypothetical protein I2486_03590 [Cellulophaga sp. E16_2]|uniref:hypothetical protein n=1 Tax=unclassified Cellulophaga TaxID=2634405 RepID=UPI0013FD8495|nr:MULTISPECIES: hypothetical protein [unclassified Cellulophaga]MBO0590482.1 hypothetical protein [Cellulophaga sp. E16_2]